MQSGIGDNGAAPAECFGMRARPTACAVRCADLPLPDKLVSAIQNLRAQGVETEEFVAAYSDNKENDHD